MKESRQHPRLSIAVDVDVTSDSNFYAGRTRDLSLGGLFVETDVGLPIGAQVDVKLKLPKGTFNVPCEVMWQLSDRKRGTLGVGVRFLHLSKAAKRSIQEFMNVRSPVDFEVPDLDESPSRPGPPPLPSTDDPRRAIPTPREGPARPKPPTLPPSVRQK